LLLDKKAEEKSVTLEHYFKTHCYAESWGYRTTFIEKRG